MGYYVRIFSQSADVIALSCVRDAVTEGSVEADEVADDEWSAFTLRATNGDWIAEVSRDVVTAGSLVEEELAEFHDFLADQEPRSGSEWAQEYLKSVWTIYAFQINTSQIDSTGWEMLGAVRSVIYERVGGLLQADNEGFSNTEGFLITWDFSDSVSGEWWAAVRSGDGWTTFKMDLGNLEHLAAFKAGEVPDGVTPSEP